MKQYNVMLKPASSLCNLRCRYCFYCDVADLREVRFFSCCVDVTTARVDWVCAEVVRRAIILS